MATAIRGMPGSEFEPRRPLQKSPPIWVVIFSRAPRRSPSCQPAPSRCRGRQSGHFLETASLLPPQAALRRFPRRPLQKENTILTDGVFFLEQHFCYAKVVACGRVIEREWGNPSKVPPSHSPFLAMCGSADNKTCGQSHKSPPIRVVIFSRAPRRSPSCQPAPSRCRGRQSGHFLETASLHSPQAALRCFPPCKKRPPSARWKPFRMLRQFRCRR